MSARRLLIVDDEKFIRKGIRAIFQKVETSFTEINEAQNGSLALDAIRREKFDLVVTDIRMPVMDGIGLMKEASRLPHVPKFIVLSGYDDFQYAKDAIRYGVKEYLLKPVKREELLDAVKRVEAELEREERIEQGSRRISALIDNFKEHELNYLIQKSDISEEEALNIANALNEEILKGKFLVSVIMRWNADDSIQAWNKDPKTRVVIREYFEAAGLPFLCFRNMKEELVLITEGEIDFDGFAQYLNENTGAEHYIGTGSQYDRPHNLSKAYMEACEALSYRVVRPMSRVIRYAEISTLNTEYKVPEALVKKISQVVGTTRREELEALFKQVFNEEAVLANDISYTFKLVECFNRHVIDHFKSSVPQKANAMDEQYKCLNDLYNFRSIRDYKLKLKEYILEINDFILAIHDTYKETYEIDAAIKYIKENLHKDLNMAMVANQVSLNYTYFSYLFSQRTGKNFMDFLKEQRIEKAKELLKGTDWKIQEVSERVGFKSPKHFTRVFKAMTGISPMEYKNKP